MEKLRYDNESSRDEMKIISNICYEMESTLEPTKHSFLAKHMAIFHHASRIEKGWMSRVG